MKKHKAKIIAGVIIVAVLAVSLLWGSFGGKSGGEPDVAATGAKTPDTTSGVADISTPPTVTDTAESVPPDVPPPSTETPDETPATAADPGPAESPPPETPAPPDTAEPPDDADLTCTLVISCATVLDNMDKLREGMETLIPPDGIIFSKTVVFYEGESVFEVLRRELKSGKIHLEFVNAPVYGSAYIEGIGNLYEFDCGDRSGWMYSVNGVFPNYGSSKYALQKDDSIQWLFTCDRGADIGGADAADSYVKN